jgi:hypothetical protein
MAKKPINTLKEFFETGDRPTQGQFEDLIDSFIHKDSGAVVSSSNYNDDTGLLKIELSDGSAITFTVPKGFTITQIEGLADALDLKVDKQTGKGLSTNDYSALEKAKVQTATEHVSDADPHVSAYDRENWDGKVNAVVGKGLSTNDYGDEDAAAVGNIQGHIDDATIHTSAEEKEAFLSKLKDYQPNEVLTASAGQILRIKDNTVFKYIGSFPFTSLDLVNELNETPAKWVPIIEVPEASNTVQFRMQSSSRQSANINGGDGVWRLMGNQDNLFEWYHTGNYGSDNTPSIPDGRTLAGLTVSSDCKNFKSVTLGQPYGDGGHFQICIIKYKATAGFQDIVDPVILVVLDAVIKKFRPSAYTAYPNQDLDSSIGEHGGKILTFIRSLNNQGGFFRPYLFWEFTK